MAGFNRTDLRQGRISREENSRQSKKLMRCIKGIYFRFGWGRIQSL
jgi:hypothetical protein